MRESFESRQRLGDETISLLGDDREALDEIREKLEQKILQALEAVKSLHMATMSIEAHADESTEMEKVQEILTGLHEQAIAYGRIALPRWP